MTNIDERSLHDLEKEFQLLRQHNMDKAREIVEMARGLLLVIVGITDAPTRSLTVSIIETLGYDRVRSFDSPQEFSRALLKHLDDAYTVIVDEEMYDQVNGVLHGFKGRTLVIDEDQKCVEQKVSTTEPVTRVLKNQLNRTLVKVLQGERSA
jgi:hypothetical protein